MKKGILTLFAVVVGMMLHAQRKCSTAEHYAQMLQTNAFFKENRTLMEEQTARYVANPTKHTRAVITIPVVFHVVYNTPIQNISDAQLLSQITILNQDFRKLNADAALIPSVFSSVAADCEIEFCLAQQDPAGNATTGIIRTNTATTSFIDDDAVKFTASGGDNIWDRNKYLNIWVCNLSGGLLGYAQFPGGPAGTDGVVIVYNAVGNVGTLSTTYNKGRTATHEVGHWLNLFHIWGDDGTACTGSDIVNDTPNQADENYGCPTFPTISCSNGPNGDMFMNYMDYVNDACMYMFTAGQKSRMNALFANGGARLSLVTSPGCSPGIIASCGTPASLAANAITTSGATLSWTAISGATSYNIQYKLNTASTWTTTTSTINSKVLSALTSATLYNFRVQAVCSAGTSAYTASSNFTTATVSACSNNFELNNTFTTTTSLMANTNIQSMIGTKGDKDYFKISTTSAAPKLRVTLSTLPLDYDVKLYNANGTLLGSALTAGTTTETIKYNGASVGANYYIYVYGYNGAFSASSCYTLNAGTSATAWRLEAGDFMQSNKPEINISPNPVSDKLVIEYFSDSQALVYSHVYSALGQKVISQLAEAIEGENNLSVDVSNLPNGIYLLEMIQNEERTIQRFMISH